MMLQSVVIFVLVAAASEEYYKARLCVLGSWPDFTGYGFNLHAERAKPAQFIGKVDARSPAEAAGLREGDRIVAVNGVDVTDETHQDVVRRIRTDPDKVELLVVDVAADVYFRERGVVVSSSMEQSYVQKIICPSVSMYTYNDVSSSMPVSTSGERTIINYTGSIYCRFCCRFVHRLFYGKCTTNLRRLSVKLFPRKLE